MICCALFTVGIGLEIWFTTLKTRSNLGSMWGQLDRQTQSLLQQKFKCCGYIDATSPPFVQDSTCTNPLVAASLGGCATPFSNFANRYLNIVFTAAFGIGVIDAMLLLSGACLFKDRKEKERFRLIDAKTESVPI